jgi:2-hydroxy-3-keto-5-methylthiopentenyl-1-phosphate phosphatase
MTTQKTQQNFQIFSDFDGTIALNDVGDSVFTTFGGPRWVVPVQEWKDGKISSKECLRLECSLTTVSKQELEKFSDQQKIDPYFTDFVAYCREHNYPFIVLSDGLSFYIKRILENYGFHDLEVRANEVIFLDKNKIKPEFPYYGKGCSTCGNCKGYHLRHLRQDGATSVYIGDGLSDRCGVHESDIVFAKDDLKRYCQENDIKFYEFNNFNDVLVKFKQLEMELI